MLTTKNRVRKDFLFFLTIVAWLAGCAPPGPRALSKGQQLITRGRYPEAIEQLKQASACFGNTNAAVWHYLGLAYQCAGSPTNALPAYQKALALNHDLAESRYNLGCLWLEQNRFETAKAELISYTLLRRRSIEGWLKLGMAQLRLHELAAAEKSFDEALRINAQNPEALNGRGLVLRQSNRPQEARQCFEDAVKQQGDFAPALLNLAVVSQVDLNDRPFALQKYREYLAMPLRPPNWDAVNAAAAALEQELAGTSDRGGAAVVAPAKIAAPVSTSTAGKTAPGTVASKAAPATPHAENQENPRILAEATPRPPAGTASNSKPALSPPSAQASSGAAQKTEKPGLLSRMNPFNWFRGGDSDSGRAAGAAKTPAYPYHALVRPTIGNEAAATQMFARAVKAQQTGNWAEAMQDYRQATQLNPAYFDAYYNLGLAATAAGDLPQALQAYENALAIRPDSSDARYNFALGLLRGGYPGDAAAEWEKVLTYFPREQRAHLALANLYAQILHQPAKARDHYAKVLEADPANPQAPAIRAWLSANPP